MKTVSLDGLRKIYPNGHEAVRGVSLEVREGEFVVLVGPSGCGKTTVLRMVAGLEEVTAGELRVGGRVVTHADPATRDMAMVFQNYALYPHMTVSENIGFSLKLKGIGKPERRRKVEETARILGLEEALDKKPGHLSGGQRQRVAMGRAIVREPAAFLMDEPLSNLDAKLRVGMRAEVSRIQRRLGVATLYVTHDQVEAMTMGDRVAVMRDGIVEQCAPPQELYDQPANMFVAGFVGSPSMNFFTAVLREDCAALRIGDQDLALPERDVSAHPAIKQYAGQEVVLGLRPEHFRLEVQHGQPTLSGQADLVEGLGSELLVHISVDRRSEVAAELDQDGGGEPRQRGEAIARVDSRASIRAGQRVTLGIDTERMHLFDPATGSAISAHTGSQPKE